MNLKNYIKIYAKISKNIYEIECTPFSMLPPPVESSPMVRYYVEFELNL